MNNIRLGDVLIDFGYITPDQLQAALAYQKEHKNLRVGQALLEVTQIGKECHNDCAIKKATGDCVMPREGIFTIVLEEGKIKPGDSVEVVR